MPASDNAYVADTRGREEAPPAWRAGAHVHSFNKAVHFWRARRDAARCRVATAETGFRREGGYCWHRSETGLLYNVVIGVSYGKR